MSQVSIIKPAVALFILTGLVLVYMYGRRLYFMFNHDVEPQSVSTPELLSERLPASVNNSSNNLKNLFELPVVFYALCAYLFITHHVDAVYVYAAWIFVCMRVLHSLVHCTTNIVKMRFTFYMLSALVLLFMIARFSLAIFQ